MSLLRFNGGYVVNADSIQAIVPTFQVARVTILDVDIGASELPNINLVHRYVATVDWRVLATGDLEIADVAEGSATIGENVEPIASGDTAKTFDADTAKLVSQYVRRLGDFHAAMLKTGRGPTEQELIPSEAAFGLDAPLAESPPVTRTIEELQTSANKWIEALRGVLQDVGALNSVQAAVKAEGGEKQKRFEGLVELRRMLAQKNIDYNEEALQDLVAAPYTLD